MSRHPLARTLALILAIGMAAGAFPAAPDQVAPAFALPTGNGDTVALDKLRGKVVYVDFWASWCAPCRRSFPWMNEMQQKYGPRDFAIVAINVDKKRADTERFLAQFPAHFTVVYDETGATPDAYGVMGIPTSYLIDARGNVTFVEIGFLDERRAVLEDRVKALLGATKS